MLRVNQRKIQILSSPVCNYLVMDGLYSKVSAFKESRLQSLYSEFSPLKEINPEGYKANIDAWAQLLNVASSDGVLGDQVVITSKKLPTIFSNPSFGEPKSLGLVLDELVKQKKYVPWSIYKDSSLYSTKRLADYVSPLTWLLVTLAMMKVSTFSATDRSGHLYEETYVPIDRLQIIGDKIWHDLHARIEKEGTYSSQLFDDEMFANLMREILPNLSDSDILAVQLYLSRDIKKLTLVKQNSRSKSCYIKVAENGELTKDDIAIIKVKASIHGLSKRVNLLEHKLEPEFSGKVKEASNVKDSAVRKERLRQLLIQKSVILRSLRKCNDALLNMGRIMQSIDEAHGNLTMIDTLLSAKSTLENLNSKISLDEVDELQHEVDEEIQNTNDITDALLVSSQASDDDELESELEKLEKDLKSEKEPRDEQTYRNEAEMHTPDSATREELEKGAQDSEELLARLKDLKIALPQNEQKESEKRDLLHS